MTCREKAKIEHPEMVGSGFHGGVARCPETSRCDRCWERELPEEKNSIAESKRKTLCDKCYSSGICKYSDDLNTFLHGICDRFPFVTPDFKCEYFNDRKENG